MSKTFKHPLLQYIGTGCPKDTGAIRAHMKNKQTMLYIKLYIYIICRCMCGIGLCAKFVDVDMLCM